MFAGVTFPDVIFLRDLSLKVGKRKTSHFQCLKKRHQINGVKASNSTPEDMFYHHPSETSSSTEVLHVA